VKLELLLLWSKNLCWLSTGIKRDKSNKNYSFSPAFKTAALRDLYTEHSGGNEALAV